MSVIQKCYNPPTCTLEITAQTSVLSRWMRQPAVKTLEFCLQFDSASPAQQQSIAIRGNDAQLETLSLTVSDYIGQLLASSHADLPVVNPCPSDQPETLPCQPHAYQADSVESVEPARGKVQLRSHTLLRHELELGSLATETSGNRIPLTTTQLFDLASALDDCAAEMVQLPALSEPTERVQPWLQPPPVWVRSAAMVVLLVGVTTAILKLSRPRHPQPTSTISLNRDQAPAEPQRDPSISADTNTSRPLPASPTPSRPVVPTPTSTPSGLPSQSEGGSQPTDALTTHPAPAAPRAHTPAPAVPPTSPALGRSRRQQPQPSPPTPAQRRERSENLATPSQQNRPSTTLEERPAAPKPAGPNATPPAAISQAPSTASEFADIEGESVAPPTETDSSQSQGLRSKSQPSRAIAPQSAKRGPLPQIAEVQQYVAQRWQAPPSLNQNLEYRLVLNPNGSLQRVEPLDTIANQYLNQLPLPSLNQPFVSPVGQETHSKIRLILGPGNTVRTESAQP